VKTNSINVFAAELKDLSTELQDLVQSKVGTTKFSQVYTQIRQGVAKVRRERKEARILQVATNPQAAASRKMHKNAVKKESKKRKNREFVYVIHLLLVLNY
jgi:U3 small nucleolar RNA-associated protein 20